MQIPLLIKVLQTAFVCVLVPAYWKRYGPSNFLWFSDIALLVSVVALWSQSALLASMQAVAVLAVETVWIIDFAAGIAFDVQLTGLTRYMFDRRRTLAFRLLSLFHVWLPPLLVWMVYDFGYDRRALLLQTVACWIILPLTYLLTDPADNINWVFGFPRPSQTRKRPWRYLLVLMVGFPLFVYLPTHLALLWLMP